MLKKQSRRDLSEEAQLIIRQEEIRSATIINRFRYIFGGLMLIPSISAAVQNSGFVEKIASLVALGVFFTVTVLHTYKIRGRNPGTLRFFLYLTLAADIILIHSLMLFYQHMAAPGNFAFALKVSTHLYLLLPLSMTMLQFRARVVWVTVGALVLIHFSMVTLGLLSGLDLTVNWEEYVLGGKTVLYDIVITRTVVYLGIAAVIVFGIRQSLRMMTNIGDMEAQRTRLSRYFAPGVVGEIASNSERLSGSRHEVTILFSDIRNFTKISEGLDPQEVVQFLNRFRDAMARVIFENGGTLDKFIGDAIMATFGTPEPNPQPGHDAGNAVRAGKAMLKELERLNTEGLLPGGEELRIGIGIHTGPVFAGTIGTDAMLEYTVIGDAVNTASRIESLCKRLQAALLISDSVYQQIGSPEAAQRMPRVLVKGKTEPLVLFKLA